jgi:hypothetical protein
MAKFHFPSLLPLLAVSAVVPLSGIFIARVWQTNTLPYALRYLLKINPKTISLDCLSVFVVMLVAKIFVIANCRLFSKAVVRSPLGRHSQCGRALHAR